MSRHTAGSLLIAGCALSWGVVGLIVREVPLPALTIVAFRVMFSAVAILGVLVVLGRTAALRDPPPVFLVLGALLALHWGLYFSAIKETSIASAVLVTYSGPIFMAMIAPRLIGEHVPPATILALVVSAAGIALISLSGGEGNGAVRPLGVVLAVGAALSMALLVVLLKRWAGDTDPVAQGAFLDLTASVVLSPALVLADYGEVSPADVGWLVLLGAVLTGFVGIAYLTALRWVPATSAGILAYMEPVSAALLAALLLGEALSAQVVAGGVAIVAAGALVVVRTSGAAGGSVEEPVLAARHA
ncbi:MAG: DMT family transporter [Solirubrobacteraceae bacterium]